MEIRDALFPSEMPLVREILEEYADSLSVDLCFQGFERELAELPGKYAAPAGRFLLAWGVGRPAGCVAMRPLGDGICEMKRLYVRPEGRGKGLGKRLAREICERARDTGHRLIRLDTLPDMAAAQGIYRQMGFIEVPPYVHNPVAGTRYLELDLSNWRPD